MCIQLCCFLFLPDFFGSNYFNISHQCLFLHLSYMVMQAEIPQHYKVSDLGTHLKVHFCTFSHRWTVQYSSLSKLRWGKGSLEGLILSHLIICHFYPWGSRGCYLFIPPFQGVVKCVKLCVHWFLLMTWILSQWKVVLINCIQSGYIWCWCVAYMLTLCWIYFLYSWCLHVVHILYPDPHIPQVSELKDVCFLSDCVMSFHVLWDE